jgi:hypothetical protein
MLDAVLSYVSYYLFKLLFSQKMAFMLIEKIVLLDWKLFLLFSFVLSERKKNINWKVGLTKVQIKSAGM